MFQLRPEISEVVGKSILITGVARSGTTIMGTLVHSLESIELLFEPPLLYGLFPLLGEMDPDMWKFLYETYLLEDFLMDSLAGRRVNFNRNDDSAVQKVKSLQELDTRLDSRYRRLDLFREALNHRIAYKMPDMLPQLDVLASYYPNMQVIIMFREPEAVVDSIMKKGWFSSNARTSDVIQGPWLQLGPDVPFWVENTTEWQQASEIEKAYIYWIRQNEALVSLDKSYVLQNGIFESMDKGRYCVINYDDFVLHTEAEFQKVVDFLGAKPTSITSDLLKTVGYQQNGTIVLTLDKVSPALRERVIKVLTALGCL